MPNRQRSILRKILPLVLAPAILAGCTGLDTREDVESEPIRPLASKAEPSPSETYQTLEQALRRLAAETPDGEPGVDDVWERLVARFEFAECPADSRAERWARWYAERPDYMDRVMQRAAPWLHHIANEIEQRDLPGELALLPIVESAYDPFAYSHGRASGSWQFLDGTARDFGIEINEWYDGRRDVYAATAAALDYLTYLAGLFEGDWDLALAAYNAGQGRVQRVQRRNAARGRGTDFESLPLPTETRSYVPKMNGLGCLFLDPARFDFERPAVKDQPRFVKVDLPGPVDVVVVSELAGLEIAELVSLNPGLNRHMTPPSGPHYLILPPEHGKRLSGRIGELPGAERIRWQEVRVQRGDTLSGLARRHNTSVAALKNSNGLNGDALQVGQRLRLPSNATADTDPRYAGRYEELAQLQQRLLPTERFHHRVRPGESLWVIARRYGVSVADIQRMNGMGGSTLIRPGQSLTIESGQPVTRVTEYVVRQGDSLWTIARRHQVGMNDLMRWNDLNANSVLRPGQKLKIRASSDA